MKKENKAVIFLKSQPIHTGEIASVLSIVDSYDKLILHLSADASIMPLDKVFAIWSIILHHSKDKVNIIFSYKGPLEYGHKLPTALKGCYLLTHSKAVFTHLSSVNLPVRLIPRLMGYRGVFMRSAYRQSRALDWLENNAINSTYNSNFENKYNENKKEGN